ncbi:MAG: Do family serine endopeptidase [Candidatus Rokuibacteriota bacterium]
MRLFAVLACVLAFAPPGWAQTGPAPAIDARSVLRALEDAFSTVADRVTPAVVNVSTVPKKTPAPTPEEQERFREFFGEEFFDRYFRRRREEPRSSGSGVIVDPSGYILTNNHVIENAVDITVRLSDSRKFTARLVGRDPKTDLAVLKVDAPAPLPVADLGDSDHLRVGQWAIAIGNPFGLDRTVTVGIVSATARTRVGVATYESFIQTDASINPGNSGGPLLNLDGKVIGVNTAMVAAGQGIGFSIPINMAKGVMRQLITRGRVVRGWLGIAIQDVTDELSSSFGVREREGVLVADVMRGGPAESAGIRPGDVIVEFGGAPVKEVPDLQRQAAGAAPGQRVGLVVVRDGTRVPLTVAVGEMPGEEPTAASSDGDEDWGFSVEALGSDPTRRLDLPVSHGVLVTAVAPGSPAERAGLRRGDVILDVKGRPVTDPQTLYQALAPLKPGDSVPLYVHRAAGTGGRNEYLALERPRTP